MGRGGRNREAVPKRNRGSGLKARGLDHPGGPRKVKHPEEPLTPTPGMTRIVVMSETLPLSSVKAHLSELVDRVEDQHDRVVLTRNGKPAAVLISHDDLESLEETLSILSDPSIMAQIHESKQALADGAQGATLAELRAGLESRRNAAA